MRSMDASVITISNLELQVREAPISDTAAVSRTNIGRRVTVSAKGEGFFEYGCIGKSFPRAFVSWQSSSTYAEGQHLRVQSSGPIAT